MEEQKMSNWKDFFTSTFRKRNQNNVVQFPGKENREFTKQKKNLAGLVVELEKRFTGPMWDIQPFHDKELEMLSDFGETISFSPVAAQRLIANLASEVFKLRQNMDEPDDIR